MAVGTISTVTLAPSAASERVCSFTVRCSAAPTAVAVTDTAEPPAQPDLNIPALQRAKEHIAVHAVPQNWQGARVVALTFALWVGMLYVGVWWFRNGAAPLRTWWGAALTAVWTVVRAGTYVRAFVLMHDAIHNALFTKRWMNYWTGIISGLMNAMDAPDYMRTHGQHHAVLGMEDEQDPDLILIFTTKEWEAWPRGISKAAARVMCDPLVLFTVFAPVWIMACNVAWPHRVKHHSARQRALYIAAKLAGIPCLYAALLWVTGATRVNLMFELLAQQFAMSYAMWLFNIEHTFEGVYRAPKSEYNRVAAGLMGSSYLPMPWWWRWATLGIEYHHLHHTNARLPCYRMEECEASAPPGLWEAAGVRTLTARDGFHCLLLSLWDAEQRRYVPFPEWRWLERRVAPQLHKKAE